jgi:DNA-binding SARP family transcriptional activator/ABC-type branched-subunit amino acid transport system substrate-binding protein
VPVTFRLLGPLEAWEDGREINLGTGRQRALLALLLVHVNEVVSADRLIDQLWAGHPPASAAKVLQGYVSQLRRVLPADTIRTRHSGYVLASGETDAQEFVRLVDEASAASPDDAAPLLEHALALWRGRALAEFEYEDWAQAEIARLEEQRLVALEERIDVDLQLGRHAQLVPELEALLAEHPLRERLRRQLMLALYRSDRQADALQAYARGRSKLDEIGLEPSPSLEELQRAILRHDAALAPLPRPTALPSALARRGRLILLAGALALAGAAGAAAWQLTRGAGAPATAATANAVVEIDPSTGEVATRIAVARTPTSIVAGSRWVWTAAQDDVTRIDAQRRRVAASIRVDPAPIDLAFGADALWLVNGRRTTGSGLVGFAYPTSVSRLDPSSFVSTGTVVLPGSAANVTFDSPPGTTAFAFADGAIWAIGPDQSVSRIDAATMKRVTTITGLRAVAVAASQGAVWVDDGNTRLIRIDPRTNRETQRITLGASGLNGIALGNGVVWVADAVDGVVWRVDLQPTVVTRTITVGIGVTSVAVAGGAVWAANPFLGTVSRIDPRTNEVTRTIDLAGTPQSIAAGDGGVWVGVTGAPSPGPRVSGVEALQATGCGPVVTGGSTATVLLASDLPLAGGASAATLPMVRAVQFVLQRHHFHAGKYAVAYQSCDDSTAQQGTFDFATCGANARAYARDASIVGVIGPINSDCAKAEIPIMNSASSGPLALIGLLTTQPSLTRVVPSAPAGLLSLLYPTGRRNFVRIVAPDDVQGAAQAILARQLGVNRLFVLSDGSTYARILLAGIRRAGAVHVVGIGGWTPNAVHRVEQNGADGVILAGYGGPAASRLIRALRAGLGKRVPLIVGDGFLTVSALLQSAGRAANGMYVTFAGRPDERLPAAGRDFVRAFASTQPDPRVPSYAAAYAAQATDLLLAAIARSDGTRASVLRELLASRVRGGILGDFSFTQGGDMTPTPVTVFRVVGGRRASSTNLADFAGAVVDRVVNVPVASAG